LQFLNASFTLLAAGPPRLANIGSLTFASDALASGAGDDIVFPIGIVQNFNLSHNRQFNRIWEVGSERSFFIAGRTVGQVGLSRIMYHGPSLLRVLYAYYQDLQPPTLVPSVIGAFNVGALTVANPHDVKIAPGYENLYLNLASDLFNQPIGLMAYFRDSNEDTVGSIYLESCYVPNHTLATDAQGTILQESAAIQFERAVPVAVSALALVDLSASDSALAGL
jgi:hypothetical protein